MSPVKVDHTERDATMAELAEALKACSFQLAKLVAAHGEFTKDNARALDAATTALAKADGR